jgi:hypothetical protein
MTKLLVVAFVASSLLRGDTVSSSKTPERRAVSSPTGKRGTEAMPLVVDTEGHKKTSEEIAQEKAEKERYEHFEQGTLYSSEATAIATILLVFVGVGGTIAALCTLRAINKQTSLQSIPFKSWITLENWKTDFKPYADPLRRFRISVNIVNQTDFPITITEGRIKFKIPGGPGYTRYELGERTFLPPKSPHAVSVAMSISDSHAETFNQGWFVIPVEGQFCHFGQLGEKSISTQRFEGLLECGRGREDNFFYEIHLNPQNDPDNSNQNTQLTGG